MSRNPTETPYCYGKLDNVFPMGKEGFRESPESCMPCIYKTECLRAAMQTDDGRTVREESVDRAYHAGRIGFWARWSKKKLLQKQENRSDRRSKSD